MVIDTKLFFVPKVSADFEVKKELASMNSLHVTTKGEIFQRG